MVAPRIRNQNTLGYIRKGAFSRTSSKITGGRLTLDPKPETLCFGARVLAAFAKAGPSCKAQRVHVGIWYILRAQGVPIDLL